MERDFCVQNGLPGDRCLPPVPVFDAQPSEGSFSFHLAKQSIQATLSHEGEDEEFRGMNGARVHEFRSRRETGAKGVRKRKAQPTRSDDGCDIRPRRPPPDISSDDLFRSRISQPAARSVNESDSGAAGCTTSHGLTRQQAILAGEKRRQQGRARKSKCYNHRAAIVSGVLVHLKPITVASAGSGSHGSLLMSPW